MNMHPGPHSTQCINETDRFIHGVLRTELDWLLHSYAPKFLTELLDIVNSAIDILNVSNTHIESSTLGITSTNDLVKGVVTIDGSEIIRADLDVSFPNYFNQGVHSIVVNHPLNDNNLNNTLNSNNNVNESIKPMSQITLQREKQNSSSSIISNNSKKPHTFGSNIVNNSNINTLDQSNKFIFKSTKGYGLRLRQLDTILNLLIELASEISSFFIEVKNRNGTIDCEIDIDSITSTRLTFICDFIDTIMEQSFDTLSFRDPIECFPNVQLDKRIRDLEYRLLDEINSNNFDTSNIDLQQPLLKTSYPKALDIDFYVNIDGFICASIIALQYVASNAVNDRTILIGGTVGDFDNSIYPTWSNNNNNNNNNNNGSSANNNGFNDEISNHSWIPGHNVKLNLDLNQPFNNNNINDMNIEKPAIIIGSTIVSTKSPDIIKLISILSDVKRQSISFKSKLNFLIQR